MVTPEELDEQRAIVGQARSDCGFLVTILSSLMEDREAYDRLGLDDDSVLDDAALIPLGTTRADLRDAMATIDLLIHFVAGVQLDRLTRFARGG